MKRWINFILILSICSMITGCGQSIPDMSQEDEDLITEYAVDMLMKHSKNNRLKDNGEEEIIEEEEFFVPEEIDDVNEVPEEIEDTGEQEEIVDTPQELEPIVVEEPEEVPYYSDITIDEFLGLEGISITYDGYEVMDTYQPGENSYFSLSASKGKTFVVLKFKIKNNNSGQQKVDMNMYDVKYAFGNGEGKKKNLDHTMTAKDIFSYQGYLEPGAEDFMVGLAELIASEVDNITEPALSMKMDGRDVTVLLQ